MKRQIYALAVATVMFATPAFAQQPAPKQTTLFTNVHVFDGVNEKRIMSANVLIEGNLIKEVSTAKIDAPGATQVDGGGRTLMPGLIDAHWHVMFSEPTMPELLNSDIGWLTLLGARGARDTLFRGTVRDVGGSPFAIKKAIDRGMLEGPRIYPSGPNISQTSGHSDGRHPAEPGTPVYLEKEGQLRIANGVPDMLTAVRENLRMGASQIKLSGGSICRQRSCLASASQRF